MGVGFGACVSDGDGFAVGFSLDDGGVAVLGAEVPGFVDDAVGFRSVSLVGSGGLESSVARGFVCDSAACGLPVVAGVGDADFVGRGWAAGFGAFGAGLAAVEVFEDAACEVLLA